LGENDQPICAPAEPQSLLGQANPTPSASFFRLDWLVQNGIPVLTGVLLEKIKGSLLYTIHYHLAIDCYMGDLSTNIY
jgi:hypothetical protein